MTKLTESFEQKQLDNSYRAMMLATARARREVELLATIGAAPLMMFPVAKAAGIDDGHFEQPDTVLIWRTIQVGRHYILDHDRNAGHGDQKAKSHDGILKLGTGTRPPRYLIPLLAREVLNGAGLWDESDERPFASGCRWGPRSLAALFSRLEPDPASVRTAAQKLLDVIAEQRELEARFERMRGAA